MWLYFISEKDKNKINLNTIINTSKNNLTNSQVQTKFIIFKKKRNYSSITNSNINNNKCSYNLNNELNQIEYKCGAKNNSTSELNLAQKVESGIKNQPKIELKIVDILAQELIQSRNEEELKEKLFQQLFYSQEYRHPNRSKIFFKA